jgi:hypothetical protein
MSRKEVLSIMSAFRLARIPLGRNAVGARTKRANDEVLALVPRQPPLQAGDRLLGRGHRQRRVAGEQPGNFMGAPVEC